MTDVTDETQILARQVLEIGPLMMRTVAAELKQSDHVLVTAHFRLLWMLEHDSASLSELAERQMVSLPTMSNSVTILEERGWVTRKRYAEDRRRLMIEITDAGREVLTQVRQQMEAKVTEILVSLTDEERGEVAQALVILRDAFLAARHAAGPCDHSSK